MDEENYIEDSKGQALETENFDIWRIFLFVLFGAGVIFISFLLSRVVYIIFKSYEAGTVSCLCFICLGFILHYIYQRRLYYKRQLEVLAKEIESTGDFRTPASYLLVGITIFLICAASAAVFYFVADIYLRFIFIASIALVCTLVYTEISKRIRK